MVDMVIPFVDNNDSVWRKIYIDYCNTYKLHSKISDMQTERYKDNLVLINYQLKLINKNMPFVRNIFLLLMNREQAPKDLPSNVKIVYHGAFIPQRFLPTFNSTTIEMFLWNIKDLGEKFIYANDDMLPIKPLKESDFFDGDKIRIEWWEEDLKEQYNMFRLQCFNSYQHLKVKLGGKFDKTKYYRPAHSMTPMIKSHCVQAYNCLKDLIQKHIRAFRTEYQYNQYIYPNYEKFVFGTSESKIDFLYTQLDNDIDLDHEIICFNKVPKNKANELKERLEKLL